MATTATLIENLFPNCPKGQLRNKIDIPEPHLPPPVVTNNGDDDDDSNHCNGCILSLASYLISVSILSNLGAHLIFLLIYGCGLVSSCALLNLLKFGNS